MLARSEPSAVFLDRDGVIVEEIGYLSRPDQLRLIPGAAAAIRQLNEQGIPAIVVTNQAGVARGYFGEGAVCEVHEALSRMLAAKGASIDAYYYCPHHPTEGSPPYRMRCVCRKPEPGMLLAAASKFKLDLRQCYLVGDKPLDIQTGVNVGCTTVLVKTGYGAEACRDWREPFLPGHVVDDLFAAVPWILEQRDAAALGVSLAPGTHLVSSGSLASSGARTSVISTAG